MCAPEYGSNAGSSSDPIAGRECLVAAMVEQIERRGYYFTDIAPSPAQLLVDLRWAAQVVGREVGCHTTSYVSEVGRSLPGRVTVVVVSDGATSAASIGRVRRTRKVIEDLFDGCSSRVGVSRDVA